MLNQVLAAVLPLILWGAVSGVLNLVLTRKSQIEAWVNANPRLAAWSKFLRGVGFDPWAVIAWFTLLVKKKLPEAQQADSPVAKLEQRKADAKALGDSASPVPGGPLLVLLFLAVAVHQQGCASTPLPCDESKLRAVDLDYVAAVSAACLPTYARKEDCPAWPALRDKHRADLRKVCPQ